MSASTSASHFTDSKSRFAPSSAAPPPHPAALLLEDIFAKAQLELQIGSDASASQGRSGVDQRVDLDHRQVAFYDETLRPRIQLYLPPSAALPPPDHSAASSSLTFALPLPHEGSAHEEEGYAETDQGPSRQRPPNLISILLSCLQISLEASYISPQAISLPPNHSSASQTSTSTNSHSKVTPLPTVPSTETGYQLQPSSSLAFQNSNPPLNISSSAMQGYQNSAPATFHSSTWFGNKTPTRDPRGKGTEKEHKDVIRDGDGGDHISRYRVSWIAGKDGGKGRWKVVWEAATPIGEARDRLVTDDTVSYKTNASDRRVSTSNENSLCPIYPDESPLERASRLNKNSSSLSNLPLDRLGEEILGSNLVTLEQGRKALWNLTRKESAIPLPHEDETESDLGDFGFSSTGGSEKIVSGGRRLAGEVDGFDLSDVGSRAGTSVSKGPSTRGTKKSSNSIIGSEVRTIRRSCRRTLDVRSAIAVRMRTLLAPPLVKGLKTFNRSRLFEPGPEVQQPENDHESRKGDLGYSSSSESESDSDSESGLELSAARDSSLERALVLCVELENPSDSGIKFEVKSCTIKMEGSEDRGNGPGGKLPSSRFQGNLKTTLLEDENVSFPMVLDQGQQVNALYYVELDLGEDGILSIQTEEERMGQRHLTIVVDGKPLLLGPNVANGAPELQGYSLDGDGSQESQRNPSVFDEASAVTAHTHSIPNFLSTWNCQVDITVLQNALDRRRAAMVIESQRQSLAPSSGFSSSASAGDPELSASALAHLAAEEAARLRMVSSNPQLHPPQSQKSVSPILSKSPMSSRSFTDMQPSGVPSALTQRRNTLTVNSPVGLSPNRGRLASLTGSGGIGASLLSPTSVTPRSSSFGLGPPPSLKDAPLGSTFAVSSPSGSFGAARTPSGGVGLGLLASAKNRASSLQVATQHQIAAPRSESMLDGIVGVSSPRSPYPAAPTEVDPSNNTREAKGESSSRTAVLPWTASSGPSVASVLRGIDAQSPILVSTKVDTDSRSRARVRCKSGHSVPSVKVLESFSLIVTIFNREVENRSFIISWPPIELDSEGEVSIVRESGDLSEQALRGFSKPNSLINKTRLLDADGAKSAHATLQTSHLRSALLPEENHVMIGPILPGTSESTYLPIRALMPGVQSVAPSGLLITDVETGEERTLYDVGNIAVDNIR